MLDIDGNTSLSPWLQEAGFIEDPFAFRIAEEQSREILWEIYLFDEQIDGLLRDERSVFFTFPAGGGQTTAQAYTEYLWKIAQPNSLIAVYDQFEIAAKGLPTVRLADHTNGLFGAISKSVWDRFTTTNQLDETIILSNCWWWKFLDAYLAGESVQFRLQKKDALLKAFEDCLSKPYKPFAENTQLFDQLHVVGRRIGDINLERLLILVSGLDNQQFNSEEDMWSLARPFLSSPHLYINSNPITWKLFFPERIKFFVLNSSSVRKQRVRHMDIAWDFERLKTLLRSRLEWASNGDVHAMELLSEEISELDAQLVNLALINRTQYGLPRTLLKLSSELIKEQKPGQIISRKNWLAFQQKNMKDLQLPTNLHIDHIKIREVLNTNFNESELRDLMYMLGEDYENLPGSTKNEKCRELVKYFGRRERILELIKLVCEERPSAALCQKINGEREASPDETGKGRRV